MKSLAKYPARTTGRSSGSLLAMLMVALLLPAIASAQPTVLSTVPANKATAVAVTPGTITITFSEVMDQSTLIAANLTVIDGVLNAAVGGVWVSNSTTTATFTPATRLISTSLPYTVTVKTGVKNAGGTALANDYVLTFVTGPIASVNLRTNDHFAILGASAVSNVPTSAIVGDIGLYPAAGSFVTGFGATELTGTLFTADATYAGPISETTDAVGLLLAKNQLTVAYNEARDRTPVPTGVTYLQPGAGDLAGLTLVPGLYKFTSSALISTPVTLTGSVNDVWIFQIADGLTANANVILAGNAQAANIFWQVGTSATIGTGVSMSGTIMADQSITLVNNVTLNGRLLARIAAIDLQGGTNAVTRPEIVLPTVTSTSPANVATGVSPSQAITATFSESMLPSAFEDSVGNFTLTDAASAAVSGKITYSGLTATFTPNSQLNGNAVYTAKVIGDTLRTRDSASNRLQNDFVWTFTTGAADLTAPTVTLTTPLNGATGVSVNQALTATFSEAMDQATLISANFTVSGSGSIAGTVTRTSTTITFTPTNPLAEGASITATITTGAKDLAGNALASNHVWSFTTVSAPDVDVSPPNVSSTDPPSGATGVNINRQIAVTFTEAMDPSRVNTANVLVTGPGTTPVAGTITFSGNTFTFHPSSGALAGNAMHTVTITTGVRDVAGLAMASNYVWSFTTGSAPDVTAPTVSSTDPLAGAVGIAVNKQIAATFSEVMDPATVTTTNVTVTGPGSTPVAGTITNVGAIFTFHPTSGALAFNTLHTVTIKTGAKDLAGNALASNYVWSFTTGSSPDVTVPTVSSTSPLAGATGFAVNKLIAATFSEAMNPATVTTANVKVTGPGNTPVVGTITNVGNIFTFHPNAGDLAANTLHTVTITTGAKDLAGNSLASNYVWSFTTGSVIDVTAPKVSSISPLAGATGVAVNMQIAATFSEAMDPATVTTANVRVTAPNNTLVEGTITNVGNIFTFHPNAGDLNSDTRYAVTITTGVKDLAGNALASNYVWIFRTGAALDVTAPRVSSTDPLAGATGIAVNKQIAATFSEPMDPTTVTTANVRVTGPGNTPVVGTITNVGRIFTFHPNAGDLPGNTRHTVTITTGAKDLSGNALASNYVWSFTTGSAADVTAPRVSTTNPLAGATGVAVNKLIAATFSEAMNPSTVTTANVTVTGPGNTPVVGTISNVGRIFTFHPNAGDLAANTRHTVTITTGARDLAGNAMANNYVWSFTTGSALDVTAPRVSSTYPLAVATGVPVNKQIAVTFSEPMDPITVSTAYITVSGPNNTPVVGTVTNVGAVFTFNPNVGALAANTQHTVTITTGAADLAGNNLASNYVWSFTTGDAPDVRVPRVSFTDPLAGAVGVAINKQISASFSEVMDPATVTTANVRVTGPGTTPVVGTITNVGNIFTFHPNAALSNSTRYTVAINTLARDLAGNALTGYAWSFTTGSAPDVTAPTVLSTEPLAGATGVAINRQIAATFSEAMDPASVTTANVSVTGPGNTDVPGTITNVGTIFTFHPNAGALNSNTLYRVTINTLARDLAGNALASYSWSFTTGSAPDVTAPTVRSTNPVAGATGVAVNMQIAATFSEVMDPSTVTTANVSVTGPGNTDVPGTITNVGAIFTFHPNVPLNNSALYRVTINTLAKDLAGNALGSFSWSFTTGVDLTTAVEGLDDGAMPQVFALQPNYPNPFNPSTTIAYQLPVSSAVRLEVYDMLGQKVRTLVAQVQPAGNYRVVWDSRNEVGVAAATGMYFYRLQAEDFVQTRRLMLLK